VFQWHRWNEAMKTPHLLRSPACRSIGTILPALRVAADLRFEADVTASPARTPTLGATSDHRVWVPVGKVTVPDSGKATLRDPRAATALFQAYRVKSE